MTRRKATKVFILLSRTCYCCLRTIQCPEYYPFKEITKRRPRGQGQVSSTNNSTFFNNWSRMSYNILLLSCDFQFRAHQLLSEVYKSIRTLTQFGIESHWFFGIILPARGYQKVSQSLFLNPTCDGIAKLNYIYFHWLMWVVMSTMSHLAILSSTVLTLICSLYPWESPTGAMSSGEPWCSLPK